MAARPTEHDENAERALHDLRRHIAEFGGDPIELVSALDSVKRSRAWRGLRTADGRPIRSYGELTTARLPWGLSTHGLSERQVRRVRDMLRAQEVVRHAFYAGLIGLSAASRLGAKRGEVGLEPAVAKLAAALELFVGASGPLRKRVRAEVRATVRDALAQVTRPRARPRMLPRLLALLERLTASELEALGEELTRRRRETIVAAGADTGGVQWTETQVV